MSNIHGSLMDLGRVRRMPLAAFISFVAVFLILAKVAPSASGAGPAGATVAAKKPASRPAGTVKLPSKKLKVVSRTRCGLFGASWRSGTAIKGGYFLSDAQQVKNYTLKAKKAKSKKTKAAQLKLAKSFRTKALKGAKTCAPKPKPKPKPAPAPAPAPAPTTTKGLTFKLKGAIGVAVKAGAATASLGRSSGKAPVASAAAADSSNLVTLQPDGTTADAVDPATVPSAGGPWGSTVNVDKVLIGPNNKVYVLFKNPTNLAPLPAPGYYSPITPIMCMLAQVDRDTGEPTCIEGSQMSWGGSMGSGFESAGIQFDDSGAIYYRTNGSSPGMWYQVIRKWKDGDAVNIAGNENMWVSGFLVLDDGTVLFQGFSNNGGTSYLRKRSPAGAISTIWGDQYSTFMTKFPDGNAYIGKSWGFDGTAGIAQFRKATSDLNPRLWVGRQLDPSQIPTDPGQPPGLPLVNPPINNLYHAPWNCGTGPVGDDLICSSYDIQFQGGLQTTKPGPDGIVYGIGGWYGSSGQLMRMYPTVGGVRTAVTKPSKFVTSRDDIIVTGGASDGKPMTSIHHVATNTDDVVFAPDEFEVFTLFASPTERKVFFSGLRFSDNATVAGYIDLVTHRPVITQERADKLDSVAIFH